nr:MAG TPA: hypothetical protein [Caudoviricetes sp.]DAX00056.1 MAG TPA: hypothetical protein [Bacteriophage sp.]
MNCITESVKLSLSRGLFDKSVIYSSPWKQKFDFGLHFGLKYKQEDLQLPLMYCIDVVLVIFTRQFIALHSFLTHPRQLPFSVAGIICCVFEWTKRCLYSPN